MKSAVIGGAAVILVVLASLAAWITHVVVCIKVGAWILLAIGAIVVPVGIIHGIGIWLGLF